MTMELDHEISFYTILLKKCPFRQVINLTGVVSMVTYTCPLILYGKSDYKFACLSAATTLEWGRVAHV